jgi:hypothetical protein
MKRTAMGLVLFVYVLSVVCGAKDKAPEVTTRVFDAPIDKVYAAAVQVASVDFNLKAAVKEAYTVNFFVSGNAPFVLTAICTNRGNNQTEVAVSVVPAEGNAQVFHVRGTREKLRSSFWQEMQVALNHMQTSPSTVTSEDKSKSSEMFSTITVMSVPEGAEIAVDQKFAGNTPSTLHVPDGDHTIAITSKGYQKWERSMTLHAGESITISATLDKDQPQTSK